MKVSETTKGETPQGRESGRNGPEVNGKTEETVLKHGLFQLHRTSSTETGLSQRRNRLV